MSTWRYYRQCVLHVHQIRPPESEGGLLCPPRYVEIYPRVCVLNCSAPFTRDASGCLPQIQIWTSSLVYSVWQSSFKRDTYRVFVWNKSSHRYYTVLISVHPFQIFIDNIINIDILSHEKADVFTYLFRPFVKIERSSSSTPTTPFSSHRGHLGTILSQPPGNCQQGRRRRGAIQTLSRRDI